MLLNTDNSQPIFVIGTGVYTDDVAEMISEEHLAPVIKITKEEYVRLPDYSQCVIGFQNMQFRKKLISESINLKRRWPSYWHSSSYVSKHSKIGQGVVIMPLSFVGAKVTIDDFCDFGVGTSIGHNSSMGTNCVFSPSVTLGGSVVLGRNVYVGMSSSLRDKITICDDTSFYMTSTVTKDILEPATYYGNRKAHVDNTL